MQMGEQQRREARQRCRRRGQKHGRRRDAAKTGLVRGEEEDRSGQRQSTLRWVYIQGKSAAAAHL
jgi:hypothetical protein